MLDYTELGNWAHRFDIFPQGLQLQPTIFSPKSDNSHSHSRHHQSTVLPARVQMACDTAAERVGRVSCTSLRRGPNVMTPS
jgi:hypothetical protein